MEVASVSRGAEFEGVTLGRRYFGKGFEKAGVDGDIVGAGEIVGG